MACGLRAVACGLRPVAGGAPGAKLTTDPLDPDELLASIHGSDTGAAVVFVGTVRDRSRGQAVQSLHYQAYPAMAQRQLERICQRCESDHPGTRVGITHRHGPLAVGEISVVIAAAAPHRDAAFAACRAALEAVKKDVPIWKKEKTRDGEEWVGWGGG